MDDGDLGRSEPEYGIAPSGYRLPGESRVGRVSLQVADLERSLAFYEGVMGFRLLERSVGRAALVASEGDVPLVELRERPGAAPVPRRGRLGLFHFAVLLPDRAALGRFVAHLSAIGVPAGASDHRVSEALYLQDPDGLGIEVYSDRPRESWRHRDRQLVMTTDPLDLDDLVAAAGGVAWNGMPPGTVIGHVHLHVGDVGAASSFYHEALGLDRTVWDYPGALFLSAGGYHHHLGVNSWASGAAPAGEGEARLLEWELLLPTGEDVEAAVRSVSGAGYPAERAGDGALLRDPWGTVLRIRTPRQP